MKFSIALSNADYDTLQRLLKYDPFTMEDYLRQLLVLDFHGPDFTLEESIYDLLIYLPNVEVIDIATYTYYMGEAAEIADRLRKTRQVLSIAFAAANVNPANITKIELLKCNILVTSKD